MVIFQIIIKWKVQRIISDSCFQLKSWFDVDARAPAIPLLNFPFNQENWKKTWSTSQNIHIGLWSLKYLASVSKCDYKAIIVIIVSSKPLLRWFIIWIKTCNSGNKCMQKLKVYRAMDAFEKLNGTVEPRYNKDLGTMKITLLYQVSHIRVKNKEI